MVDDEFSCNGDNEKSANFIERIAQSALGGNMEQFDETEGNSEFLEDLIVGDSDK